MIACDVCGCLVEPSAMKLHSDWHDSLLDAVKSPDETVANPKRPQK